MKIGKAIKLCRSSRKFTLHELSEKVGISYSYLSLIENSKRLDVPVTTLNNIAKALSVPLSVLLFMASDANELAGFNKDIKDKLSLLVMELLSASKK